MTTDDWQDLKSNENLQTIVTEGFKPGQVPVKLVTGRQESSNLNFELKPGAIVAHPNSTVLFVCG